MTTEATETTTEITEQVAGQATEATEQAWYSDENKGIVELRGWRTADDAIKSYQNLHTLLGADKADRAVVLPKDESDTEGWQQVFSKLGRPEKPDGYEIAAPEGNSEFAQAAAAWFHEAGLTKKQAQALAGKWNEYVQGQTASGQEAVQKSQTEALNALKGEWGDKFDAHAMVADQAFATLGIDTETAEKLAGAMGRADVLKLFHRIGEMLTPDRIEGGKPVGQQYTPAAAQERLKQLMEDQDWLNRWANGDTAARAEKDALDKAIAAGKEAA